MDTVLSLCIAITVFEGAFMQQIEPPDKSLTQTNKAFNFIYYTQKMTWSAARAVCQSIGGDLAKIDSEQLMDSLESLAEDVYQTNIFSHHYWVGLIQLTDGQRLWVTDCTNLTWTENYSDKVETGKSCFKHRYGNTPDLRDCTTEEGFMCQVLSTNRCQFTSRLTSEVLAVGTEIDSCQSLCEGDPDCWATVEYVPDNCVTLALPGHGVQNLTLTTKFCYNITLNTTTAITPDLTNNNVVPNATCGSFAITPTPTNSSVVSSIALPPCQPVNVTQNVTLTSTESITVTTTNYSTFTSTFTSTEQITVTSTVLSTYTQNVTTEQAEEIAAEIAKNLTIDSKSTSSHIRRLTSAEDKRRSAKFVGYVGVIFVAAPLGIMLLLDIKKLFLDFRSHDNIYKKK